MNVPQFSERVMSIQDVDRFAHEIRTQLINRMIPGLGKEGFEPSTSTQQEEPSQTRDSRRQQPPPRPMFPPLGLLQPQSPFMDSRQYYDPLRIGH